MSKSWNGLCIRISAFCTCECLFTSSIASSFFGDNTIVIFMTSCRNDFCLGLTTDSTCVSLDSVSCTCCRCCDYTFIIYMSICCWDAFSVSISTAFTCKCADTCLEASCFFGCSISSSLRLIIPVIYSFRSTNDLKYFSAPVTS